MTRHIVLTRHRSRFYPDGIHHPVETSIDCPPMPEMLMGFDRVLIDEGGEFQVWGGYDGETDVLFGHEIFRGDKHPAGVSAMLRRLFDEQVRRWQSPTP